MTKELYWVERARSMLELIVGSLSLQQMDTYARTAQAMALLAIAEELHTANAIATGKDREHHEESPSWPCNCPMCSEEKFPADTFVLDRDCPLRKIGDEKPKQGPFAIAPYENIRDKVALVACFPGRNYYLIANLPIEKAERARDWLNKRWNERESDASPDRRK